MRPRSSKYLPNHPLAGSNGKVTESRLVLWGKLGGQPGACHWCDVELTWATLCADHVDHDTANNDPSNLVASCRGCNANREDGTGHGRRDMSPRLCAHCGGPFTARPENHLTQLYCSRSCSNAAQPRRPRAACGTRSAYKRGCRCADCRAANAAHARAARVHSKTP